MDRDGVDDTRGGVARARPEIALVEALAVSTVMHVLESVQLVNDPEFVVTRAWIVLDVTTETPALVGRVLHDLDDRGVGQLVARSILGAIPVGFQIP